MSLIDFFGCEDGQLPAQTPDGPWWAEQSGPAVLSTPARTGAYSFRPAIISTVSDTGFKRILSATEEHATIIIGAGVWIQDSAIAQSLFLFTSDANATQHIYVSRLTTGAIEVRRGGNAGPVLGTSAATALPNMSTWYYVEVKVVLSDTVGVVEVRVNGAAVLNLTAQDTKNAGTKTVIDHVGLGRAFSNTTADAPIFDDVYVVNGAGTPNDFLGAVKAYGMLPNANGSASDFVGSDGNSVDNYLLVDERPPTFTDFVQSSTVAARDLYNVTNLGLTGTWTVHGVRVLATARNSDANVRSLKLGIKSGATVNMDAGRSIGVGSTVVLNRTMDVNPVTGVAFTLAEIDALEIGVEVL